MAEEAETRIVTGILKKKSEVVGRNGPEYQIDIECQWFESLYDQKFWVPLDVGAPLAVGSSVKLVIYNTGLISDKYDGSLRWHYKWRFVRVAYDDEIETVAPTQPRRSSAPAAPRPTDDDRQLKIMLQHASSVAAQAYGDWYRLFDCDDLRERPAFDDYLVGIAVAATWYLDNVYVPTGYRQSVDDTETNDPWDQAVDA